MPKAAKRRKTTKGGGVRPQQARASTATSTMTGVAANDTATSTVAARRRAIAQKPRPLQDLIFPIMVALGCWGMAFTLAFFYSDPNHYLFAAMAALMALLWTFSATMRVRKALLARQQSAIK
jgi:hypothetical protein